MAAHTLLFLDFDGVICDSVDECFLTSWIAYYHYYRLQQPSSVRCELRKRFGQLRPFIRAGEDYLLLHRILEQAGHVQNQAQFDLLLEKAGKEQMAVFKQLFYKARQYLVTEDFLYWCRLNRLYPHITPLLQQAAGNEHLFILSTKKPEFINAILKFYGISFAKERILYPGSSSKISIIGEILATRPDSCALFVDDQIDHLAKETHNTIKPYLASWGYIKPEWLKSTIPVLYPDGAAALFLLARNSA